MGVLGDGVHRDPSAIEYLALEGGGGKGFAFVGAVEALEDLRVLPVGRPDAAAHVQGIAGTSAGAITALLLALGLDSKGIRAQMNDREQIGKFMDAPSTGTLRRVTPSYPEEDVYVRTFPAGPSLHRTGYAMAERIGLSKWLLATALAPMRALYPDLAMLVSQLQTAPVDYLHNLLYEWGFFPGLEVRAYFRRLLRTYLPAVIKRRGGVPPPAAALEAVRFQDFRAWTGLDFKIAGTNVSRQEARLFSADDTPDFPVAEAVGLSMSLPFVYKPVCVERFPEEGGALDGLWVDGGLLTNLPIHAFDQAGLAPSPTQDPLSTLHPGMLALRLSSSGEATPLLPYPRPQPPTSPSFDDAGTAFALLWGFLGAFGNTVLYPSEQGQLRSPVERRQTIELFADSLSTYDFLPEQAAIDEAIGGARETVEDWFAE